MPCSFKSAGKDFPLSSFSKRVSSYIITPLMYSFNPAVDTSKWRYALRFAWLFSTFIGANRLPMVPVDSSAARIPLPAAPMARAVSISSAV